MDDLVADVGSEANLLSSQGLLHRLNPHLESLELVVGVVGSLRVPVQSALVVLEPCVVGHAFSVRTCQGLVGTCLFSISITNHLGELFLHVEIRHFYLGHHGH